MNILAPLQVFLTKSHADPKIRVAHIAVYLAIYEFWLLKNCKNPIEIDKNSIMNNAKISSSATWHQTIRALHEYGYIKYMPSFNRFKKSKVFI